MKPLVGLLSILGLGLYFIVPLAKRPAPSEPQFNQRAEYERAVSTIKAQLKAPATAAFTPRQNAAFFDEGGQRHLVLDVDAQNSFGAVLRSRWVATWKHDGTRWLFAAAEKVP